MTNRLHTFSIADPKTLDGDPFEVAQKSVLQSQAIAAILVQALNDARAMACSAELERQLVLTEQCDVNEFERSQGRIFEDMITNATAIVDRLRRLNKVVSYKPRRTRDIQT